MFFMYSIIINMPQNLNCFNAGLILNVILVSISFVFSKMCVCMHLKKRGHRTWNKLIIKLCNIDVEYEMNKISN